MKEKQFFYQKRKPNKYMKQLKYFFEDKKLKYMNRKQNILLNELGIVLFCIFLVLKLAKIGEVANWSWWLVTLPLWMPTAIVLAVVMLVAVIAIIFVAFNSKRK